GGGGGPPQTLKRGGDGLGGCARPAAARSTASGSLDPRRALGAEPCRAAENLLQAVGADPDVKGRGARGPPASRLGRDGVGARLRRRAERRDQLEVAGPPALLAQPARALGQVGELLGTELPRNPALPQPASATPARHRLAPP